MQPYLKLAMAWVYFRPLKRSVSQVIRLTEQNYVEGDVNTHSKTKSSKERTQK